MVNIWIHIYTDTYTWHAVFWCEIEEHLTWRHDSLYRRKPNGKGFDDLLGEWVAYVKGHSNLSGLNSCIYIMPMLTILENIKEAVNLKN